ncbi:hypothetical protein AMS68_000013 [Peltaster fructicola]|uniref:TLC domain-containing protein n=1 Tax=Peltaster fructicola TaxID=286661 RepID=A0A6H0XIF2_9PEZI|nr:hypothetical protein AMS68_000013 [Peltaster fructicola]
MVDTVTASGTSNGSLAAPIRVRPKRAGSSLGADPRGDTGVGSLTTIGSVQKAQKSKGSSSFFKWSLKNTWIYPLIILLTIATAYIIAPGEDNPVRPALFLSYANPPLYQRTNTLPPEIGDVTQYGKGKKDFAFVAFYTVFFTFTREFLMQRVILPIALWYGIRSPAKQARFMEQFYTAIYFGVFGPYGLWVMSRTPVWYFNTIGMYEGFPHRAHEVYFKAYYLLQAAYWAQQAIVLLLMLEKPRKDFKELVLHHIVTLSLIYLSYAFHFTYMGLAVYITHDISDFFLASAKVLNYIESPIIAPYFVFFIGVWAYLRHYINLTILWSMRPGGEFETVGRYDLSWPEHQYKCYISHPITFGLLATLQAVNLFWFFLICRILFRLVFASDLKDDRSDEEDLDEVEDASSPKTPTAASTGIEKKTKTTRRKA